MRIAVVADDLTGALDTGVQFTKWGYTTQLVENPYESSAEVTIINTDTRNKTSEQAYRLVYSIVENLSQYNIIYKKLDSTLRGNPGTELEAILTATGETQAILTPTYPSLRRRVKNGHLYIAEKLITKTEYVQEYKNKTSYIPEILDTEIKTHVKGTVDNIPPKGITIVDSETEQDLIKIATRHTRILAGSAGLADALCQTLRNPPPVLTIVGSIRSETREQVEQLQTRLGAEKIPLNTIKALNMTSQHETIKMAENTIKQNNDLVLSSAPTEKEIRQTKIEAQRLALKPQEIETYITKALAEITKELLNQNLSGIIITGGATALAVTKKLGVKKIEILDEIQPGVPVLRLDKLTAVTKAGGFGQQDILIQATKYLKRKYR
jgi:uncharacterized protein YgbK (DUF1537 family)